MEVDCVLDAMIGVWEITNVLRNVCNFLKEVIIKITFEISNKWITGAQINNMAIPGFGLETTYFVYFQPERYNLIIENYITMKWVHLKYKWIYRKCIIKKRMYLPNT